MKDFIYDELNDKLILAVPEIRKKYEEECEWWEDEKPGPHIVFGDILTPFIISVIKSRNQETEILDRIFNFLEQMSNHEDIHIQEVVAVSVIEYFVDDPNLMEEARKYMGPTTVKFSYEMDEGWKKFFEEKKRSLRKK